MGGHFVNHTCTNINTPGCIVQDSVYGYAPSIPFNAFFLAFFFGAFVANAVLAWRFKTWFYGVALAIGVLSEALGYGARIKMHSNPFDKSAFTMQITLLIYSPAFIAAAIYVTLKHFVLVFGERFSRVPATWYTWMFITCDTISLVLQASGGAIAGGKKAQNDVHERNVGTDIMMAGIIWQVITLTVFAFLVVDYYFKTRSNWAQVTPQGKEVAATGSFKIFAYSIFIAFIAVYIRCVYRIAELAGGWANKIMSDQPSFIALEGG